MIILRAAPHSQNDVGRWPTHLHDRRVSLPSPGPTAAPYRESGTPHTANGAAPRRGCARDIRRCKSTPHISTPYFTCEAGDESVYVSVRSRSAVDMIRPTRVITADHVAYIFLELLSDIFACFSLTLCTFGDTEDHFFVSVLIFEKPSSSFLKDVYGHVIQGWLYLLEDSFVGILAL